MDFRLRGGFGAPPNWFHFQSSDQEAQQARNRFAHNSPGLIEETDEMEITIGSARGKLKAQVARLDIVDLRRSVAEIHLATLALYELVLRSEASARAGTTRAPVAGLACGGMGMPNAFDVRSIEEELRRTMECHAPRGATLSLVDSVQGWVRANGYSEDSEFRQAVAFPALGLVVMAQVLNKDAAQSSGSVLTIGPFAHEALAQDLRRYALFLLLHEIAHLRGMLDEKTADAWALETLNHYLATRGEAPILG